MREGVRRDAAERFDDEGHDPRALDAGGIVVLPAGGFDEAAAPLSVEGPLALAAAAAAAQDEEPVLPLRGADRV